MTAFDIKLIAIITMLIDHTGAVLELPIFTRMIGRIAFPLFVFLIAEGCRHTKSMEKYLLRLGAFALISEIPFDLAFNNDINFLYNTNIFYTLFLGVACVYAKRIMEERNVPYFWLLMIIPVFIASFLAEWFSSDYGAVGILFIFITALVSGFKYRQLGVMALFCLWLYYDWPEMLAASLISIPIAALASGKQGQPVKWLFYWFYPVHLAILVLAALIFM